MAPKASGTGKGASMSHGGAGTGAAAKPRAPRTPRAKKAPSGGGKTK